MITFAQINTDQTTEFLAAARAKLVVVLDRNAEGSKIAKTVSEKIALIDGIIDAREIEAKQDANFAEVVTAWEAEMAALEAMGINPWQTRGGEKVPMIAPAAPVAVVYQNAKGEVLKLDQGGNVVSHFVSRLRRDIAARKERKRLKAAHRHATAEAVADQLAA